MPEHGERKARRRVGDLLNSYYHIDGADSKDVQSSRAGTHQTDQQSFNADQYFDDMVSSGHLPDLVKTSDDLNKEITGLDTDMQEMVYTNYTRFIGAADIIKQMKFTIDGFGPELRMLDEKLQTISHHEQLVERGVAERSSQIELLLKQQRVCKKLTVLFSLPTTLKGCLDRHAYGSAVEAYCCCTPILRQYQAMPSFRKVLGDVELQMGRIRQALEQRLKSPDLPVGEAVNSSLTLLSLGEDATKVAQDYLSGRAASLQATVAPLMDSLPSDGLANAAAAAEQATDPASALKSPLWQVCQKVRERCLPKVIDTVDGFRKLQSEKGGEALEELIVGFVRQSLGEMCKHIAALASVMRPPTRVLVACLHFLRDSCQKLHSQLPSLLTDIFRDFFLGVARACVQQHAKRICAVVLSELPKLEVESSRLQAQKAAGLDEAIVHTAAAEEAISMHVFDVIVEGRLLAVLFRHDPRACSDFTQELQTQCRVLQHVFLVACDRLVHRDADGVDLQSNPTCYGVEVVAALESVDMAQVVALQWNELLGLGLFRICRHMETKLASKVASMAQELGGGGGAAPSPQRPPPSAAEPVVQHARATAQTLLAHYVLVNGFRLAELLKSSIQSRNWMTVKQPKEPRVVVEVILREAILCDAQLGRLLGDMRKPQEVKVRRPYARQRNNMELEMERLWAKKQKIYGSVAFSRTGAVMGIMRIVLKAFYENIRDETFGTYGFQQIQVDCAYFSDIIRDVLDAADAGVLDSLLDETVGSAAQRCVEPVYMDDAVVSTICEEKRKNFKAE